MPTLIRRAVIRHEPLPLELLDLATGERTPLYPPPMVALILVVHDDGTSGALIPFTPLLLLGQN